MRGPPLPPLKYATVTEMLDRVAQSPAALHFIDAREREHRVSFAELAERAARAAAALSSLGVDRGDRVAIVLPTSMGFMDAFFGALLAGAVPVPLYPPVRLGRLEEYHARTARMLEAVGARLVVSAGGLRSLLGESVARTRPGPGLIGVDTLTRGRAAHTARSAPEELALIQFSSGTTVDCKPVALSHANLLANVAAIDSLIPADARAGVSWLPLYHDMGLIGCLLEALYRPGDLALIPPELFLARPALWLRAISRHRATVSPAPNFAYGLCTKRIRAEELDGVDLSSWQLALNGAEPVSPAVLRAFAARFAPWGLRPEALTPVYGLSEAALAVTFTPPRHLFSTAQVDPLALAAEGRVREGARELVSVGTPVPGVEVEVRGERGVLADGCAGRIHVRGPSVMRGYFGAEDATRAVLVDGWLDTGDLGFVHRGELFVCGRAKELVVIRGANRSPQEFEECLEGLPGLRAGCAVAFGFVNQATGCEELALLAETQGPARSGLDAEISGRVAEHTGVRPAVVELLPPGALPRTSSGKLKRTESARLWEAGALAAPAPVSALRVGLAAVRGELALLRARFRS